MKNKKDIIIIGGGASGMMCAIKAKENNNNKSVCIIEKQARIGRKLLSTGNGRCNLTNLGCRAECYNGSFSKNIGDILGRIPPKRVMDEFSNIGLSFDVDSENRVYPLSHQASAVLDLLRFRIEELSIEVITDTKITEIKRDNNMFRLASSDSVYYAEKVVFSTGSCAAGKLGADASGISILESLGIRSTKLSPALCPLPVAGKNLSSIKGVRAGAIVTLCDGGKPVLTNKGEVQFTENSLSGICIFDLSAKAAKLRNPIVKINLLPRLKSEEVINLLKSKRETLRSRSCDEFLIGTVNNKLGVYIMKSAGVTMLSKGVSTLTDSEIKRIADNLTALSFKVAAPTDFNSAQVVSGGIHGEEINPKTMECRKIKNLFIIGEAVDIDGICGGYNLQFAFASGIIAGESL